MNRTRVILELLRADGSIVINKRMARNLGLDCAIMYAELISRYIYFSDKDRLTEDGYFFNTIEQMEEATTLNGKYQRAAIKKLTEVGLIDCTLKGLPATRHFKIMDSEEVLLKILSDPVISTDVPKQHNLMCSNGTTRSAQMEQQDVQNEHINNTKIIIKKNNKKEIKKDITAKADPSKKTLFDLPPAPVSEKDITREDVSLARITNALDSGDWKKVTTTDFVRYFTVKHNDIFPVKQYLPQSKDGNFLVSLFKKNFLDRFQISPENTCRMIDQILQAYKQTETHPDYRNSFTLETFRLDWKIDQLMRDINRLEEYGSTHTDEYEASGDIPDVF